MTTLFWLLVGHSLADFPLQGEFLSASKRMAATPCPWWIALTCHSLIHAGVVALITGSMVLALLEFAAHWSIDYAKTKAIVGFTVDQAAHFACKVAWTLSI